ncbi:hypothetical protein AKJ16_DCAP17794 [Drosera capensis]
MDDRRSSNSDSNSLASFCSCCFRLLFLLSLLYFQSRVQTSLVLFFCIEQQSVLISPSDLTNFRLTSLFSKVFPKTIVLCGLLSSGMDTSTIAEDQPRTATAPGTITTSKTQERPSLEKIIETVIQTVKGVEESLLQQKATDTQLLAETKQAEMKKKALSE